jgi:hypothetical protein
MNATDKIKLVYIASIGRSGSTLLESMLGAHSAIETMGELHIWPHEITHNVRPCSCGEFVETCPFWSEMRRRVDPLAQPEPRLHFFREKHNAGRTLRLPKLAAFRRGFTPSPEVRRAIETYGENNEGIFRAFISLMQEQQGVTPAWIVDASKDPYRLAWLHHSGRFDIRVVHLVKDPRAFIYSVTKHLSDTEAGFTLHKRLYYTARQSAAWIAQNALFSRLAASSFDERTYRLVKYESLATDPEGTFRGVCEFLETPYEAEAVKNFREGSVHTIAGNPMRYETRGISLDEKWKTRLPASSRTLASILTAPTKSRYGYL